jgi:hypothetical protein
LGHRKYLRQATCPASHSFDRWYAPKILKTFARYGWFQHDGVTACTANTTTALLQKFLRDRIVERGVWPPRSPDLTPPDFFLWVFLKEMVSSNNLQSLKELESTTDQTVANIVRQTPATLQETLKRVYNCL